MFEIPTGVVADSHGRRTSHLLVTITLGLSTLLYYLFWMWHVDFVYWAGASLLLGLGFTFFSGAVEAWLVDALESVKYGGKLEKVFGKAQMVNGAAMLIGTLGGGILAQFTNLGVPYVLRAAILLILFVVAWRLLQDIGFTPAKSDSAAKAMRVLLRDSVQNGIRKSSVGWLMASGVLISSVGFYVFYALQPYILEIYGNDKAYWLAGLAAMLMAALQMVGGMLAGGFGKFFSMRTSVLIFLTVISSLSLFGMYIVKDFWLAIGVVLIWSLAFAIMSPVRQAYLNGMIASKQRATVLSFDSMLSSSGGIVVQPSLARSADIWSYGLLFAIGAGLQILVIPFLILSRKARHQADTIKADNVA